MRTVFWFAVVVSALACGGAANANDADKPQIGLTPASPACVDKPWKCNPPPPHCTLPSGEICPRVDLDVAQPTRPELGDRFKDLKQDKGDRAPSTAQDMLP
jgi:hypothetical protein